MIDLARKNAEKYNVVVVAGGDGSIHNVINGVKQSKGRPTLGFLPYGTVNDVCRTLNVPKDLDKAIDVILRGDTIKYDIMQEGNNYMIYTFAGGMFVSTSFKTSTGMKRVLGKVAYFITGAKQLFSMRTLPLTVTIDGERIVLTYKEYELLHLFLSQPGIAFTREQLLSSVWNSEYLGETRTVDMHIRTLRQKLGEYGNLIETVRNVGYRLEKKYDK